MSGKPWPRTRACDDHVLVGSFVVACARLFGLFARVAPRVVCDELEAPLSRLAFADGDPGREVRSRRGHRGVLASSSPPRWAAPPSPQGFRRGRERFHGGVAPRGSVRGEGGSHAAGVAARCEPLLAALSAPVCQSTATVSQQARRLEAALMCVAELAAPPVSDASIAFQGIVNGPAPRVWRVQPAGEPVPGPRGRRGGQVGGAAHRRARRRRPRTRPPTGWITRGSRGCAPRRTRCWRSSWSAPPDACRESLRAPAALRRSTSRRRRVTPRGGSRRSRRRRHGPGPRRSPDEGGSRRRGKGSRRPRGGACTGSRVRSSR